MSEDWTHEASVEIGASAATVHAILIDTTGWRRWNAGVSAVAIDGPFVAGARFAMTLPDGNVIESVVLDVGQDTGFTDRTVIGQSCVVVSHLIEPRPENAVRVRYATQVTGPDAAELGEAVTADFLQVLAGLRREAEASQLG